MNSSSLKHLTLEEFGLSSKICKKLGQSNIITVEDLINLNELQLMSIPLLGPESISEIKTLLNTKRLKLYFDGEGSSIEELGLSLRIYNSLTRNGINTIEVLRTESEVGLMKIRGLGTKSVDEIIKKLNSLN